MRDVITDAELRAIAARCDRARPGPWTSIVEGRDQQGGSSFIGVTAPAGLDDDIEFSTVTADEQDFIAHARQDVPLMVVEIERRRSGINIENPVRLTPDDLRIIQERAARVPPGPWKWSRGTAGLAGRYFLDLGPVNRGGGEISVHGATEADLDFIAHARQDVVRLLAELTEREESQPEI